VQVFVDQSAEDRVSSDPGDIEVDDLR